MNVIKQLRRRVLLPDGRAKRGAISRLAERAGVSRTAMRNWVYGYGWQPGREARMRLQNALNDPLLTLAAKKPGPKTCAKNKR